jgi:hypothetical protein
MFARLSVPSPVRFIVVLLVAAALVLGLAITMVNRRGALAERPAVDTVRGTGMCSTSGRSKRWIARATSA